MGNRSFLGATEQVKVSVGVSICPTLGVENMVATIASVIKDTDRTVDQDERAEIPKSGVAKRLLHHR